MLRMLIQTFVGPKSLRQCVKLASYRAVEGIEIVFDVI